MNKRLCRWTIAILLAAPFWASGAEPVVQISVLKKAGEGSSTEKPAGEISKGVQKFHYVITVANPSTAEVPDLEVRYSIFVDRQRIGEKADVDHPQRIKGRQKIEPIKSLGEGIATTKDVGLKQSNLSGGYYYANGGRISAKDAIKGIWVRVYHGDAMIAEYVNPSTIQAREKWED
jgi:hypothetical protein